MTKRSETIVYVAGPYRAENIAGIHYNINRARMVAMELWELGFTVFCPHLNSQFMDGIIPDDEWLKRDLVLLRRCDVITLTPQWDFSEGASGERQEAISLKMPVWTSKFHIDHTGELFARIYDEDDQPICSEP